MVIATGVHLHSRMPLEGSMKRSVGESGKAPEEQADLLRPGTGGSCSIGLKTASIFLLRKIKRDS
jgi:hypothetical protein